MKRSILLFLIPWLFQPALVYAQASKKTEAVLTVAVIGDYGVCSPHAPRGYHAGCRDSVAVARMVREWNPAFVLTTGDNSYDKGLAREIPGDQAPYSYFIHRSRFFPALGNHDWGHGEGHTPSVDATLRYFRMPHRYYLVRVGDLVTFYLLDTNPEEPDGDGPSGTQARWFFDSVRKARTTWQLAFNHQPPTSTCKDGLFDGSPGAWGDYRWIGSPGIDLVFSGHNHVYERMIRSAYNAPSLLTYIVVGTGGAQLDSDCGNPVLGQQKLIIQKHGAVRLTITRQEIVGEFFEPGSAAPLDRFVLPKTR